MLKTPLKKDNIIQHFTYGWWMYALAAALLIFGWQMAYAATEYVPPADKMLQITIAGDYVSQNVLDLYEEKAYEEFPELERVTVDNITLDITGEGDYSGATKLQVVIAVGEGDIYILDRDQLVGYGGIQAFRPLDDAVAEGGILHGLFTEEEIAAGTFTVEDTDGLPHVYGISAARLYGLMNQGVDTRNMFITCTSYTENEEYALKALAWLAQETGDEPPVWMDELQDYVGEPTQTDEDLPQIG